MKELVDVWPPLVEIVHGLGKHTIAEFVTDGETLDLLRQYQIDYAQGFYVADSRPLAEVNLGARAGDWVVERGRYRRDQGTTRSASA